MIKPTSFVAGRVVVGGGAPEGPVPLVLVAPEAVTEIGFLNDERLLDPRARRTVTDADGRFRFEGLPPGWSGGIHVPSGYRLQGDVYSGGIGRRTTIRLDAPAQGIEIALERRPLREFRRSERAPSAQGSLGAQRTLCRPPSFPQGA